MGAARRRAEIPLCSFNLVVRGKCIIIPGLKVQIDAGYCAREGELKGVVGAEGSFGIMNRPRLHASQPTTTVGIIGRIVKTDLEVGIAIRVAVAICARIGSEEKQSMRKKRELSAKK